MNRILFFPREDDTCKKPQKVKMKPTPRKTGERVTRSQGPAVLLNDISQLKSPQKTTLRSTRSTKVKLEVEQMEPQEPTETVTPSLRSSKRKVVSGNTMEVTKSLKKQTSRRTRSVSVACEEDSVTEDSDNGPVVAEDKTSNKLEIDGTSESLNQKTKVKTSAEKSDVSKDTAVEIVSASNDKGHVDSLPEEDDSVDVRMPVLRSSRRLTSIYGTGNVADKPVARKTRSSASVAVEVSELKSIVESLAEKVATAKESKMSPVLDSPLKVCKEKTKTVEEEPEIEVIENPEKVEVKQMAGKSKSNEIDSVLGSEDGKGGIKRLQEQKASSADVASGQSIEHENSAEAFVVSKKSQTPKKSANITETEENVSVEKGNEKSIEKSKKKSFDASDTIQETIIGAKMNEESALEAGTKTETEISLLAESPTGNLSTKTTPHKSAEKPKSSNRALPEAREVREEEIISFISSCRQGLTESSSEKSVSEEIKLPEPDPVCEIMEIEDSEFVQTEQPAEESSDVILLLDDSNEEIEILKSSKTKLESPKKPKKDIEKLASPKLLQKTEEILLFDTLESTPEGAVLENLSRRAAGKVSGLETPKTAMETGDSLKTPKSTRSVEEMKLAKSPKSVKKSSKEKQLTTPREQKVVFPASDEDSVEELECKQVSESVNSEEAKTPKETSKKLKSKTPSVESSAEETNLKNTPKSVKSSKENLLTPKSQRDTFLETGEDSEDKQVSESVNSEEVKPSKTPKKLKSKMPFAEDEISEKLICDQEPECLKSSFVEAVATPGYKESCDAVTGVVIEGPEQPVNVSKMKKLPQSSKKSSKKANLEPDLFELVSFDVAEESIDMQVIEEQVSETLTDRKLPDLDEEANCDNFPVFTKVKSPKSAPKETSLTGEVNMSSLFINGRIGDKLDIKNDNKDIDSSDISFVPISKEILKKEKSPIISWIKKLQMNPPTVMNLESKRSKQPENKISTKTSDVSDQQRKAVLKSVKKLIESETSEDEYLRKLELKKLIKKLKEKAARGTLGEEKSSEIGDKPKKKSKKNKETVEVTDETETVDEIVEEPVKCNRKMKKKAIAALELTEETVQEVQEEQVKLDKKKKKKSREASELTEKIGSQKRKLVEDSENIESSKVKKSKKVRSIAVEDDIEGNVDEVDDEKVNQDKKKKTMKASKLMEGTVEEVHEGQVKRNKKKKKKSKKASESTEKIGPTKRKLDEDSENVESSKVKKSKKVQSVDDTEVKKPGVIITSSIPPSADSIEIQDLFFEEGIQLLSMRKRNNKDEIVIKDADQVGTAVSLLSNKYFGGSVRIDKNLPNTKHDGITDDEGLRFSQVYINRIPLHATEADILSLFPKALRCDLPKVKEADVNKGFCYLTFPDKATALEHIVLNGQVNLFGHKLGIHARQKDCKQGTYGHLLKEMLVYITDLDSVLIVEDIPLDMTMLELSALFPSVLHKNKKVKNKTGSHAVVICKDAKQAEGFLSQNIVFKDKTLSVIRATSQLLNIASNQADLSFKRPAAYQQSTLIVSNLPKKTEVQHLTDVFPSSVLVKLVSKSYAHVGFPTRAEMLKIYRNGNNATKIMDQPVKLEPYKDNVQTFIKKEKDFCRLLHVRGFPEKTKVADLQKIFKHCKISLTQTNSLPCAVVKCKTKTQAESYLARKNLVVHGKILKLTYVDRILKQMKREAELNLM